MDEMLDPEMARLRAMRVADLIDGLVGLESRTLISMEASTKRESRRRP